MQGLEVGVLQDGGDKLPVPGRPLLRGQHACVLHQTAESSLVQVLGGREGDTRLGETAQRRGGGLTAGMYWKSS